MSEQVGGTQGLYKCCKRVGRWIPCTWNGEILLIIDIAAVISVQKSNYSHIIWQNKSKEVIFGGMISM